MNCFSGGLDIAALLIKEVVSHITTVFPSIHTFSTLSPIPKFLSWLTMKGKEVKRKFCFFNFNFIDCYLENIFFKQSKLTIPIPPVHHTAIEQALLLYDKDLVTKEKNSNKNILSALSMMLNDPRNGWLSDPEINDFIEEPVRRTPFDSPFLSNLQYWNFLLDALAGKLLYSERKSGFWRTNGSLR
jgi:hypothetical protein